MWFAVICRTFSLILKTLRMEEKRRKEKSPTPTLISTALIFAEGTFLSSVIGDASPLKAHPTQN